MKPIVDWVDEHENGAVELIARKSDGTTLAIEHTLIQPYPLEKEDFARFDRAFSPWRSRPFSRNPRNGALRECSRRDSPARRGLGHRCKSRL